MTELTLVFLVALVAGLAAAAVRLPALVGFLAAGFVLSAVGVAEVQGLAALADLGVALLLFTIGLKLDVAVLARREVWMTTVVHTSLTWVLAFGYLAVLAVCGVGFLAGQDRAALAVVALALTFSSTVLVLTLLERSGATQARSGQTALGVLVIQDLVAVGFLTWEAGTPPSIWALLLVALVPASWLGRRVLRQIGRDELVALFGVCAALGPGYVLFEAAGVKGDLGALVMGLLLARDPRAEELAKAVLPLKEVLLVAFFVSLGLAGIPSGAALAMAALLLVLIPLKSLGFVMLLWSQGMRHRTSVQAGTSLGNYSEFALIVVAVASGSGLIESTWLVVLAVSVAASFVASSLLNEHVDRLINLAERTLPAQDPARLHPEDRLIDIGDADAVVFGMGRVGHAVYRQLREEYGLSVLGIERREDRASSLRGAGVEVIEGDALDPDLWHRLTRTGAVDIAVLAMPFHGANLTAMKQLEASDFAGVVAAIAKYEVEAIELRARAQRVLGLYDGAGAALADGAAELAGLPRRPRG